MSQKKQKKTHAVFSQLGFSKEKVKNTINESENVFLIKYCCLLNIKARIRYKVHMDDAKDQQQRDMRIVYVMKLGYI